MLREAFVISDVLDKEEFDLGKDYFINHPTLRKSSVDENGRWMLGNEDPFIKKYHEMLLPVARSVFKSETLLPTNALFVEYSKSGANLPPHFDANACTYTIDLCFYESHQWPLWVENTEFKYSENEAVCFFGEEQMHWRETLYEDNIKIGLGFFHYVEPTHWYFTEGPSYVETVRNDYRSKGYSYNRTNNTGMAPLGG
jgi:hypothetical protein